MSQTTDNEMVEAVRVTNPGGASSVVLVCEHASHEIPATLGRLGLAEEERYCHAVWDIGAVKVATHMSERLDACLVASGVSRLVYDCNRPPTAPDAMPAKSEVINVPGNANLSDEERLHRTETYYEPFRSTLSICISERKRPILVTIHSFTPVYFGNLRPVEIGILHDDDTRLADAMLKLADKYTDVLVQRNEPYGPKHGVTHTLREHAIPIGCLNVMLEVRNDLVQTEQEQHAMGNMLAIWVADAVALAEREEKPKCRA